MKIHEYQAKQILRDAGVSVPRGIMADTSEAVFQAFGELGGGIAVVKAQIHAGGRGKGTIADNPTQHGVQLVRSAEEARRTANNLLGHTLVTIQTGPAGQVVRRVLVEQGCRIGAGIVPGDRGRPDGRIARVDGVQRGWNGHRARGRHLARADLP